MTGLEIKTGPEKSGGLSVCVPVHNHAAVLERLLAALARQNLAGLEVVAVDNASTDGSVKILEAWRDRLNLKIFSTPHTISMPDHWLLALSLGTGEFLKLQLADHGLPDGALSALVDGLRRDPRIGFIFGNTLPVDEKGEIVANGPLSEYYARCNALRRLVPASTTLLEKARFLENSDLRFSPVGDANALMFRASLLPQLRRGVEYLSAAFQTWPEFEIFLRLFVAADGGHRDLTVSHVLPVDERLAAQAADQRVRRRAGEFGFGNMLILLLLDPDLKPLTAQLRRSFFARLFWFHCRKTARILRGVD